MAPAKKKPPVTGSRQMSDKGRPAKSTPQQRPTSAMPGPRPKTSTRTSNTSGMASPKPASTPSPRIKVPAEFNAKMMTSAKGKPKAGTIPATRKPAAKPAAKPATSRGITMSGDRGAAIKGAGNPAGPRAPKPSWDQKGNLKRPALPAAGQTSGNRTATRIEGMRNRIIANTAAGKPSGVRTGQPANIKGTLPAAGQTSGNQANAAKSARVAGMQARRAAEATANKPSGVRTGQPAGATNRMYGADAVNAAIKRAQGGPIGKALKVGKGNAAIVGLSAISGIQDQFLSPKQLANKREFENYDPVGPMLKKLGGKGAAPAAPSKYGTRFKNMNSGASAAKGAKPAASTSNFAGARDAAMAKAKGIKGSPVLGPKIVGPKKVGSGGGGGGTIAQAFDKSFAAARKAGKSEFTFQGKRYNTKMK